MLVQNYGWPTGPAKLLASQNMALAGPTAVWVASGHREARPMLLTNHKEGSTGGLKQIGIKSKDLLQRLLNLSWH